MTRPADLAVVGGGVLGVSLALRARSLYPSWSITVVDQQPLGRGATGHSLAVVAPSGHTPYVRALATRSAELYRSPPWRDAVRPRRALLVAPQGSEALLGEQLTTAVAPATPAGLEHLGTAYESLFIAPTESVYAVENGFLQVDPVILSALLTPSRVEVVDDFTVVHCRRSGLHWDLTSDCARVLRAERVALCTGPWGDPESIADGVPWGGPPGSTKRVAALHVPRPGAADDDPLLVFPQDNLLLSPGERRVAVSFLRTGTRSAPLPVRSAAEWSSFGADVPFGADDLVEGRAALAVRCPEMAGQAVSGQAFWDTYLPGSEPRVERAPGSLPPLVRISGAAGSGVRLAPALADEALARLFSR
ncbi:FAD-dependent oxidoreductase [Streptomyces sp. NPDC127039]|uniref:FAD-dependent oxidoreductase n=1 Tax=Streptomyces sp. NPDC127039 TaxID=3347115 RepID=UPI0036676B50